MQVPQNNITKSLTLGSSKILNYLKIVWLSNRDALWPEKSSSCVSHYNWVKAIRGRTQMEGRVP